jgi:6-phosphogluconolactonase (cycloisomerase 2 family)
LYVTTGAGLAGYSIDVTGSLTALPGFPVASGSKAYSVTVDQSDQFLYVGNGGLSALPGSPFAAGSEPDFITIL